MKNETLKAILGTVRIDKYGKEIEKPKQWADFLDYLEAIKSNELIMHPFTVDHMVRCQEYQQATEAIKLVPLSEFVNTTYEFCKVNGRGYVRLAEWIVQYTDFITQQLTKGQFVPTGEDGEVLEEPEQFAGALELDYGTDHDKAIQFQKAQEKVIFEGINCSPYHPHIQNAYGYLSNNGFGTIEQAINNGINLYLKIK